MTVNELISNYLSCHPTNNTSCDGEHCTDPHSRVRIIPLDDSVNVHLCPACYSFELSLNEQLELDGKERILPDLPWEIYPIHHSLSPEKKEGALA